MIGSISWFCRQSIHSTLLCEFKPFGDVKAQIYRSLSEDHQKICFPTTCSISNLGCGCHSFSFVKSVKSAPETKQILYFPQICARWLTTSASSVQMMADGSDKRAVVEVNTDLSSNRSDQAEMLPKLKDTTCSTSLAGLTRHTVTTVGKSTNIAWQECMVKKEDKQKLLDQKGCLIWITGLSGSGKSTLACALDHVLLKRGNLSYILDGDNLRHGLNKNLGFSADDRKENIRRIGEVAKLFVDAGLICIASVISPYRKDRDACRQLLHEGEFIEVFMNFPLSLCEERDPKGLYKLARAGKIKGFTGVDGPYEPPLNSEIVMEPIEGRCPTPEEMAVQMVSYMEQQGLLGASRYS